MRSLDVGLFPEPGDEKAFPLLWNLGSRCGALAGPSLPASTFKRTFHCAFSLSKKESKTDNPGPRCDSSYSILMLLIAHTTGDGCSLTDLCVS